MDFFQTLKEAQKDAETCGCSFLVIVNDCAPVYYEDRDQAFNAAQLFMETEGNAAIQEHVSSGWQNCEAWSNG